MKILKWLDKNAELVVMSLLLIAIVGIMFTQIVMRYVFKSSLRWPEEACRYIFIWMSYIGISYSAKTGSLMKVDIIHTLVPKVAPFLNALGDLATLAFFVLMVKPGFATVAKVKAAGSISAALSFPMYLVYLSLAVGVTLGLFRMVQKYVLMILNRKHGESDAEKV